MERMSVATGTFDVKLNPLKQEAPAEEAGLARLSIDKQFHGDLSGKSLGEMMAVRTAIKESAGYVAIERVTGTLAGRSGNFVLQHTGIANRGALQLTVGVVPDSGTDGLTGLAGSMAIVVEGGKHTYTFTYTLPDA
jgi:Protein of unknown function (DUF3224)